jgi:uncharacterized membrane protein
MSLDNVPFQTSTIITSNDSKTTTYMFTWLNFSKTMNGQLIVGDVFAVSGFFNQLYGDGALQITYSANYTLKSVTPTPDAKDDSTQTLQWLGTQFFVAASPSIILVPDKVSVDHGQQPYLLVGSVSAVAVAAVAAGWFLATRKRKQNSERLPAASPVALLETEEEKIIKVLRSSGGSAYQSSITEQTRFSKAKTSQLLTALEAKGVVQRHKRGRDKIVNLNEQVKGEK